MANGAILRGEVYWVCVDDSVGSEQQTGRPALIISGDKSNEKNPTVIVAYLTTGGFGNYSSVSVNYVGKPERVLCNQVRTIDKQRLTRYMGKLSEPEMRRVSGGLAVCMCIRTDVGAYDDVFEKEDNEEVIALKAELEMWKRSYDIAMTQLVELKVSSDIAMRMARREPVVKEVEIKVLPKVEESPVVKEPEPPKQPEPDPEEPERVEINTCTAEDLKRCGCTEVVAKTIVAGRPYMEVDDLRRIPGITSVGFGILKHKICCVPVKVEEPEQKIEESEVVVEAEEPVEVVLEVPKKVNINTATSTEIMEHLGIGRFYPGKIVTHRNKNGNFVDLEE
jgi:mRNA interferase MazF